MNDCKLQSFLEYSLVRIPVVDNFVIKAIAVLHERPSLNAYYKKT